MTWFRYTVFPVTSVQPPEQIWLAATWIGCQRAAPNRLPSALTGTKAIDEAWAELMATRLKPPGTAVIPSKCVNSAGRCRN